MILSLDSIEKYLEKVRIANRSRSKNVQLTIEEAQELATTLAQIMIRHTDLMQQIVDLQSQTSNIDIQVKAGSFK